MNNILEQQLKELDESFTSFRQVQDRTLRVIAQEIRTIENFLRTKKVFIEFWLNTPEGKIGWAKSHSVGRNCWKLMVKDKNDVKTILYSAGLDMHKKNRKNITDFLNNFALYLDDLKNHMTE